MYSENQIELVDRTFYAKSPFKSFHSNVAIRISYRCQLFEEKTALCLNWYWEIYKKVIFSNKKGLQFVSHKIKSFYFYKTILSIEYFTVSNRFGYIG